MNLLLVWLCPVCLTDNADTACDSCGRPLTANDLTPFKSQEPPGHSGKEAPNGSQTKGD